MPPRELYLKVGAPVILLSVLDASVLCVNIMRLVVVRRLVPVFAIILIDAVCNGVVFIQRMLLLPADVPFEFKQFVICPYVAMTYSVGQTINSVCLYHSMCLVSLPVHFHSRIS